jgi:hypothetical protein
MRRELTIRDGWQMSWSEQHRHRASNTAGGNISASIIALISRAAAMTAARNSSSNCTSRRVPEPR